MLYTKQLKISNYISKILYVIYVWIYIPNFRTIKYNLIVRISSLSFI
jgi:hypothetical protein